MYVAFRQRCRCTSLAKLQVLRVLVTVCLTLCQNDASHARPYVILRLEFTRHDRFTSRAGYATVRGEKRHDTALHFDIAMEKAVVSSEEATIYELLDRNTIVAGSESSRRPEALLRSSLSARSLRRPGSQVSVGQEALIVCELMHFAVLVRQPFIASTHLSAHFKRRVFSMIKIDVIFRDGYDSGHYNRGDQSEHQRMQERRHC